eukprot:5444986-Amphidinium_carterae.1
MSRVALDLSCSAFGLSLQPFWPMVLVRTLFLVRLYQYANVLIMLKDTRSWIPAGLYDASLAVQGCAPLKLTVTGEDYVAAALRLRSHALVELMACHALAGDFGSLASDCALSLCVGHAAEINISKHTLLSKRCKSQGQCKVEVSAMPVYIYWSKLYMENVIISSRFCSEQ